MPDLVCLLERPLNPGRVGGRHPSPSIQLAYFKGRSRRQTRSGIRFLWYIFGNPIAADAVDWGTIMGTFHSAVTILDHGCSLRAYHSSSLEEIRAAESEKNH